MAFNPKKNDEQVYCFGCNASHDIFAAAAELEGLPSSGPGWVTQTIPSLCETLDIPVSLGEPSAGDKEKAKLYKLCKDISDILEASENPNKAYMEERLWENELCTIGSISAEELTSLLIQKGWDSSEVASSLVVATSKSQFFGEDKVTFVLKDFRGRPHGFVSRCLGEDAKQKYINSLENPIYDKRYALYGLENAVRSAKKDGLYIVEGPGDVAQANRLGIVNVVAVCGTAFTEQHLLLLKSLGIRNIYLCFDWDNAGYLATSRVIENVLKATTSINVWVICPTLDAEGNTIYSDPDEYLRQFVDGGSLDDLKKETAFEWQLQQMSENDTPDAICTKMIPSIATESSAVRRELLITTLGEFTGISHQSIASDVDSIRDNRFSERREAITAAAESYVVSVKEDPDGALALMAQHEDRVAFIEKQFARNVVGVNYQLERYEAIQEARRQEDGDKTGFRMNWHSDFARAMDGGQSWASGCLTYVGGRANSGKTAVCLSLATDVALSDEDAIVIVHTTDDSYTQIEPRLKTNAYRMCFPHMEQPSIGAMVNPKKNLIGAPADMLQAVAEADDVLKGLIANERLVVIDMEDGSTLSVLERNVKYYRRRHPSRKILVVCDNTHNYMDFLALDQMARMTRIANAQKAMTGKYHLGMIATAEYRKNMPKDASKMVLPVDDDLADARALMYRPNVIFHVYNDLHDRKDHAEIFWKQEEKAMPRLLLNFTKNKISGFKSKLVLDLDPSTVTLCSKNEEQASNEANRFARSKKDGNASITNGDVYYVDATEYEPVED
jgi:DNA primase catalytic core